MRSTQSIMPATVDAPQFDVVIIGAGIAGLGAAVMLKEHGYTDFVVLERAADVGGVWRDVMLLERRAGA